MTRIGNSVALLSLAMANGLVMGIDKEHTPLTEHPETTGKRVHMQWSLA